MPNRIPGLRFGNTRGRAALACAAAAGSIAASVFAADRTWLAASDRFFSDPNAWSGGIVPGSTDNAHFTPSGSYSVLFITSPANEQATVSNGTVSFDLGGRTYSLSSTASTSLIVGTLNLFFNRPASLSLGGTGAMQDQSAAIGNTLGPGTVTVGSASWSTAGTLTIGNSGLGSVNVNASGIVTATDALLGAGTSSTGNLSLGGAGALFRVTGSAFDIGSLGNGNVTINPGAHLDCGSFNSTIFIGRNAGSRGTANLSGGSWTTVLSTAGGIVQVGYSGAGTINTSSGTLSCRVLQLGTNSGAAGSLNVSGAAVVTTTGIGVGGGAGPGSAAGGAGQVNVSGGTLNGGQVWLWPGGAIKLNGGNLLVTNIFLNGGSFGWTSGLFSIADGLTIGPSGMFPTLTLDANKTLKAPSLTIGDLSGPATVSFVNNTCTVPMAITNGSAVTVNGSLATLASVSSSSLTVSGGGTLGLSANAFIGGGTGSVSLSQQSHLMATPTGASLTVGQNGSAGTLLLSGGSAASFGLFSLVDEGFVQIDASTWTCSSIGTAYIGISAPGTLVLRNAGAFQIADATLGQLASSAGLVTVTGGGSLWTVGNAVPGTGTLIVGRAGTGSLSITNGAAVHAIDGYIGQLAGSTGSVLIDAAGLGFQHDLYVGMAGTASLTVSGGGSLQCAHGYIGQAGTAIGTVTLIGAGSGWTGSTGLDIGGGQSGWLTLAAGATLSPGGSISINANGVLDYAGGSLGPTTLSLNSGRIRGSGSFAYPAVNTNGIIEVESGTLEFASSLTNSAGSTLTKVGPGAARIASFVSGGSGTVLLNGGALAIGSDLGTGADLPAVIVNDPQARLDLGATQHLSSVNILAGRLNLLPDGSRILVAGSISLAGSGATIDLADNDLQYNYTGFSPYPTVAAWILTGRNGGTWDGPGILSSAAADQIVHPTTIGIMEGYEFHMLYGPSARFDGQDVFNSSLLLKYTYGGDSNYDGQVDVVDLGALATHWQTAADWLGGDFNYDGFVDVIDLGMLATNWQAGVGAPLAPASLAEALAEYGLPSLPLPEPPIAACACLSALLATRIQPRRQRRP